MSLSNQLYERPEIIEKRLHCTSFKSPQDLLTTLRLFCKSRGFGLESFEMRNDEYIIRLRPNPHEHLFLPIAQSKENLIGNESKPIQTC